ncbi:hypothetical protein [Hymenobacter volaticus]|uniref:STAS domain-containing protein n=1 Tax=Hymenobacter volaticus TaxID=2932254 RepID=A0ABY4GET9_9BACT|nr:hypothetical protein [Hymenobacter volaticus]UOQ69362.1 hypothetical protein MUN86_27085 [Hymenobacter volaticus]
MLEYFPVSLAGPGGAAALTPVNLAGLDAKQLASLLVEPPAQLLVDCGSLFAPHPLGIGHFVSLLLNMRRRRTDIWLCNVDPVLHECLHQLKLGALFHLPA